MMKADLANDGCGTRSEDAEYASTEVFQFVGEHRALCPLNMSKSSELRQRTFAFAVRSVRFCRRLAEEPANRGIAHQLLDSSTSVAANYRVACRGRSRAEFIAKLGLVVEEADETVFWLELIQAIPLDEAPELAGLLQESRELLAIFAASTITAKLNAAADKRH